MSKSTTDVLKEIKEYVQKQSGALSQGVRESLLELIEKCEKDPSEANLKDLMDALDLSAKVDDALADANEDLAATAEWVAKASVETISQTGKSMEEVANEVTPAAQPDVTQVTQVQAPPAQM